MLKRTTFIAVMAILCLTILRAQTGIAADDAAPVFESSSAAGPTFEDAFSPHQGATALVVKSIGAARRSIRVAAYSFTSRPIADALIRASSHGLDVRVVLDKSQLGARYGLAGYLASHGVPTRINSRYAIMHDKFMVLDDTALELGSFNYTKSAEEKNAENVLIVHNDPPLIASYARQWQKIWDEAACRLAATPEPLCG